MITWRKASASAPSVPGLGWRWISAFSARPVFRGSITMILHPAFFAERISDTREGADDAGFLPHRTMHLLRAKSPMGMDPQVIILAIDLDSKQWLPQVEKFG